MTVQRQRELQLSPTLINSHQLSSTLVNSHQLSSTLINSHLVSSHQLSPTLINSHQLSSTLINSRQLSPTLINSHPRLTWPSCSMSTRGTYPNYITGVMDRFEHDFNILELMSNYIIRLTGYLVTIQDDFSVQASKGVCSRRKILSRKFEVDGI